MTGSALLDLQWSLANQGWAPISAGVVTYSVGLPWHARHPELILQGWPAGVPLLRNLVAQIEDGRQVSPGFTGLCGELVQVRTVRPDKLAEIASVLHRFGCMAVLLLQRMEPQTSGHIADSQDTHIAAF